MARFTLTTKDVFLHFVYISFFNLHSACCNYNTLQLNIRGRSWGQKAVLIPCQIATFFSKQMNHHVINISYRRAAAQISTLPGGRSVEQHVPPARGTGSEHPGRCGPGGRGRSSGECGSVSGSTACARLDVRCLDSGDYVIFMALR